MPLVRDLPAPLDHPAFDVDGDERDAMEIFHAQTCLDRRLTGRRGRIVNRFRLDAETIRGSAKLYAPALGERIISLAADCPAPPMPLSEALSARVSTRRGDLAGALSLAQIGDWLGLAVRTNRDVRHARGNCTFSLRPYPSGGALYPCEVYLWPVADAELASRPYRYDARAHALVDYGRPDGDFREVERCAPSDRPACAAIITAVLDRSVAKYGLRGYRFSVLEAGHIGQNLTLSATALGLPTLVSGSYYENELERRLGLNGLDEVVLSVVMIGAGMTAHPAEIQNERPASQ